MAKQSFTTFTTPAGTAGYLYLSKPDTKFKEDGEYRAQITLDSQYAAKIEALVEAELVKSVAKAKEENPGKRIKQANSPVHYNDDGTITLNTKCPAFVTSKKTGERFSLRPTVFDGAGNRLNNDDLKAGQGSTIRVSVEIRPYFTALVGAGVTLRVRAVQILKLVEFGGGNASGFGFDNDGDAIELAASKPERPAPTQSAPAFDEDDDVDF